MTLWDIYAWSYDILNDFKPYQCLQMDIVTAIAQRPTARVLNIGCGTGNLEHTLLKENATVSVTSLDFSLPMLRRARRKNPQCQFLKHDLNTPLPFGDNSFDIVIACNVLYATPLQVMREIERVVLPNGLIVIADPIAPYSLENLKEHLSADYVDTLRPLLNPVFFAKFICFMAINLIIDRKEKRGIFTYRSQADWLKLFPQGTLSNTYAGMDWLLVTPPPLILNDLL
jgi:ubiquinone/menaquinone biosynthesis C-methylase UbiE